MAAIITNTGVAPGQGYRNGVRQAKLKTAVGIVEFAVPQVAGRDEPDRSRIAGHLIPSLVATEQPEDLAVKFLACGLSVGNIEDARGDEAGRLLLSRTALSKLGERLWADYQEFIKRDLSEHEIAYLVVDGIAGRSGRRTSWSAYSSRSASASRSSPAPSARSRPSSSCSAP